MMEVATKSRPFAYPVCNTWCSLAEGLAVWPPLDMISKGGIRKRRQRVRRRSQRFPVIEENEKLM